MQSVHGPPKYFFDYIQVSGRDRYRVPTSENINSTALQFTNFCADEDFIKVGTAADLVQTMRRYDLDSVLPLFWKASRILSVIPATSCSAERSFSALRRMKTYLRSTMGQDRLNNLAIINIERAASNRVLQLQMNEIIDTFGRRKNRGSLLF